MRRTVVIDGEPVGLMVDRLTIDELETLSAGSVARGSSVSPADVPPVTRRQLELIDRYVEICAGDVLLDGAPVRTISAAFGGQTDTINDVFNALVEAQLLTADERHDLMVAARFLVWLGAEQKKKASTSKWVETGSNCAKCHALALCAKRACGTTPSKKPVWHDSKIHVRRCPVLSLTPDVERALRLFEWTHVFVDGGFRPTFLPGPANLGDQEAWTIAALAHLRVVYQDVYAQSRVTHE